MTDASPEPRDRTPFVVVLDRIYAVFENFLNMIASIAIMGLMLLAVWQIVGRTVFNAPVFGYIDLVEQVMILFAFIGAAYCQRLGGHIRMELVIGKFRGRLLWFAEIFGVVVGLVVIGLLIPVTYDHFLRAYNLGDSTIDANLPIWPAKLLIPIGLSALFIRLVLQLIGYARLFLNPSLPPEAVPLITSIREEAEREIREATVDRQETGR